MHKTLTTAVGCLAVLLVLPQSVAAQRPAELLAGNWKLDAEMTRKHGKAPDDVLEKIGLELEFKRDGTTVESFLQDGRRETYAARWKITEKKKDTLILEITDDQTKFKDKEEIVFLESGKFIKILDHLPNGRLNPIIFVLKRFEKE